MYDAGDIATFGFLRTAEDDILVVPKPVSVTGYAIVDGDLFVGEDAAITGDITAGGSVTLHTSSGGSTAKTANFVSTYIDDLSTTGGVAAFAAPFDGWVKKAWVITWGTVTGAGVVRVTTPTDVYTDIAIAAAAVAGDIYYETVVDPPSTHFESGETIQVSVQTGTTADVNATVVLTLLKAWE